MNLEHSTTKLLRTIAAFSALALGAGFVAGCSSTDQVARSAAAQESADETSSPESWKVESTTPQGDPWVVSLGDSIISGEAGRWAGNQSWSTNAVDALGDTAYHDGSSGEQIENCHRSKSAAIHIGDLQSMNLACSGATTYTRFDTDGSYKPGIDFYDQDGRKGQALMLQEFAAKNRVEMVALSIGANDFKYGPTMEACVKAYLLPSALGKFCQEDGDVKKHVSDSSATKIRTDIKDAILNIAKAMENSGYSDSDWTLGLQLYPDMLANPEDMRYAERGYDRQLKGGCGFRDKDSTWINDTYLALLNATFADAAADAIAERPTLQVVTVDASNALSERTLCHTQVNRVRDDGGVNNWKDPEAADKSEWVMEVNIINVNDTYLQESMHPNYWGQLALRSCWRQAWNGGNIRGGVCQRDGTGLNAQGEPNMVLN